MKVQSVQNKMNEHGQNDLINVNSANEITPNCKTPELFTAVLIKGDVFRAVDWQIFIDVSKERSAFCSGSRSPKSLTSDL